ncbi:MAG TPA: HlyD family secretion protein [Gemmataceae bacterium]|nr:HlyD family secretion protein [Gemmataceae bacterium]
MDRPSDHPAEHAQQTQPASSEAMAATTTVAPPPSADAHPHPPAPTDHRVPPPPPAHPAHKSHLRRNLVILGIVLIVLAVAVWFLAPWLMLTLTTVSTDDAYVNSHVTYVAPRVAGQVVKVLVDDNNRVKKGDVLVQLDKTPYQIQVDLKAAALATAQAQARAQVGLARGTRFKLEHAIQEVDNQIALLRANVAALKTYQARLTDAENNLKRGQETKRINPGAITQEDLDKRQADSDVAAAQFEQARETVLQIRVGLGLPATPEQQVHQNLGVALPGLLAAPLGWGPLLAAGVAAPQRIDDLTMVPPDLDLTFSAVRQAEGELLQSAAPLGIVPSSYDLNPKQLIEDFYKQHPEGDIDRIYAGILPNVPAVKQAEHDLEQAKLNLCYCDIVAQIDGQVTNRNVNPGNDVQVGQNLMAVRSLTDVWIDANFKETQLAELRIGQRVRLDADMYGSRQEFKGRISGFSYGTGSTLALLPPENATGNFVKIVQRLPVRIDLVGYDPEKTPLFAGLSVEPYVFYKEPPTGPDAGKVLQPASPLPMLAPDPHP